MKRVLVGMSGGVDSSVTAYLLQKSGFEVVGATFRLFDESILAGGVSRCCSIDDVTDAKLVCNSLGIPHYTLNYETLFEKNVVSYFCQSYVDGFTPNPCIACNQTIKFDTFWNQAQAMGFDYIATGHYARIILEKDGLWHLKKATYLKKDQSYVLYHLGQNELPHILMPLGNYSKEEVRSIAADAGLTVAKKAESQDICFIPDGDYAAFLERNTHLRPREGNFVNRRGQVIGKHQGYYHYTVGQRRGLGMGFGERMYVLEVRPQQNEVVLGEKEELYRQEIWAENDYWVSGQRPLHPISCLAKLRYSQTEQSALLTPLPQGQILFTFSEKQREGAPGQSVVFYENDDVLGGAQIQKKSVDNPSS